MEKYVLAIDQGTTSSRAIIFDTSGSVVTQWSKEFTQIYPHPGWVEHNAVEIFESVIECIQSVFRSIGCGYENIDSIGITNQRETTVLWDKKTGIPVHNAIVWQCRRTASRCNEIKKSIYNEIIFDKTGLVVDPYFCATKIESIFENNKDIYKRALNNEIAFGTIESYLIYRLSNGKSHVSDYSNASRTMLFNIHTLEWDKELLEFFTIPESILPKVIPNSQTDIKTDRSVTDGFEIPISGVIGDQQAALFGQRCFNKGDIKNTYGTGCFLLMNTGDKPRKSKNNLLSTIAWNIDGKTTYAMEGAVFIAGAVVQWLRDGIQFIENSGDSESLAHAAKDNGVIMVPAFTGLGSPYWDPDVRGAIFGITRDTGRAEIAKAALQSIAFQTAELVNAMKNDFSGTIGHFYADGGASANNYLMQFQSDLLHIEINAVTMRETTALGAAFLAGLATGYYENIDYLKGLNKAISVYKPSINSAQSKLLMKRWQKAVEAVRLFGNGDI